VPKIFRERLTWSLCAARACRAGGVRALFAASEDDDRKKPATAARDAAILALLYGSGLRRAEAVGLEVVYFGGKRTVVSTVRN